MGLHFMSVLSLWILTVQSLPKLSVFWLLLICYFYASSVLLKSYSIELKFNLGEYYCSCFIDRDVSYKYRETHNKTQHIAKNLSYNWMMLWREVA